MTSDLGFIEAPCHHEELIFEPFMNDQMVIFAAPGHPFANGEPVHIDALRGERWYFHRSDRDEHYRTSLDFDGSSMPMSVAFESDSTEAIKSAVRDGRGLGCMSGRALAQEFASRSLIPLNVIGVSLDRVFGVLWHRMRRNGVLQKSFNALLLTMLGARDFERSNLANAGEPATDWVVEKLLPSYAA
jgi:DNA-binding transcriptional LysR family regulator